MSTISLIAAVDEANGLGYQNKLLCHLPADLKHFKALTLNKTIIMGRKTYESIGRALPNRRNIILSKHFFAEPDITVVNTLDKALDITKNDIEVMIIGGAGVYEQTISRAARLYITKIHHTFVADVFFPHIDSTIWHLVSSEKRPKDNQNAFDMTFCTYENRQNGLLVNKIKINEKSV